MRRLPALGVLSLGAPALLLLPVVSRPAARQRPVPPSVVETPVSGIDRVAASDVAGFGELSGPPAGRPVALTGLRRTAPFSLVGVTWADDQRVGEVEVAVRLRQSGRWTGWQHLDADSEDAPDAGSTDLAGPGTRAGTAPVWVGDSDGVQVRVSSLDGAHPTDVRAALIDPGRSDADAEVGAGATLGGSGSEVAATIGQPPVVSRRAWGADESIRRGSPSYAPGLAAGFVHHTASTNNYSSSQAAAMVRGIYAYHVRSRGWSDIGYNFLVDRYGRIYEGRYGGIARPVVGAHTGGFNHGTFGVSLLGTYSTVAPSSGTLSALERVFAWKTGLHYIDPNGYSYLTSAGGSTSRFPAGTRVRFRNVSGHRDAGYTTCPGSATYARMPEIRYGIRRWSGASLYYPRITGRRPLYLSGQTVRISAGLAWPQSWSVTVTDRRTGLVVRRLSGSSSTGSMSVAWDLKNSSGVLVPPGRYRVHLDSWNSNSRAMGFGRTIEVHSPLPSGLAVRDVNGVGRILTGGRVHRPTPALLAALRPGRSTVPAYPTQLAPFGAPSAAPDAGTAWRASNGSLWLVTNGERRPVSLSVARALGLPTTPPYLDAATLALLPVGPAWTDAQRHPDGQIVVSGTSAWRLEQGRRRLLTPAAVAAWARGHVRAPATRADLARPTGPSLGPPEGTVLLLEGGGAAGVVAEGHLTRFSTLATATGLGYTLSGAPTATRADLAALSAAGRTTTISGTSRHPTGTLLRDGTGWWEVRRGTRLAVPAAVAARDGRRALRPAAGEMAALTEPLLAAPNGQAGVSVENGVRVIRVMVDGRLVRLSGTVAGALGYAAADRAGRLPVLAVSDFAAAVYGPGLVDPTRHPDGSLVAGVSGGRRGTWLLTGGRRRPISAASATTYRGRPVLPATAADLALPLGSAAPPADGSWLRVAEDDNRRLIDLAVRRNVYPAVRRRIGLDRISPITLPWADIAAGTVPAPAVP